MSDASADTTPITPELAESLGMSPSEYPKVLDIACILAAAASGEQPGSNQSSIYGGKAETKFPCPLPAHYRKPGVGNMFPCVAGLDEDRIVADEQSLISEMEGDNR